MLPISPPNDWEYPDWDKATPVHDWKNYATSPLIDIWHELPSTAKKVFSHALQEVADREEWE